jgi:hypothetical protein
MLALRFYIDRKIDAKTGRAASTPGSSTSPTSARTKARALVEKQLARTRRSGRSRHHDRRPGVASGAVVSVLERMERQAVLLKRREPAAATSPSSWSRRSAAGRR